MMKSCPGTEAAAHTPPGHTYIRAPTNSPGHSPTLFQMFLYSPRPWPAALATPGTAVAVPTNLTLLRTAFSITSELTTGLVAVDLRGVSYPGFPIMRLAQDQVS